MLEILSPGFLTTLQDLGRRGFERFGVPVAGALDAFALRAANALVNNPPDSAGLEFTLQAPVLRAWADCLVAAAGPGVHLWIDGRPIPTFMAAFVRRGWTIRLEISHGWGYLAAAGGIDTPPLMGSRATYLRAGLGGLEGRALQTGDLLALGLPRCTDFFARAGANLPAAALPYDLTPCPLLTLNAIPGPQVEAFTPAALETFYNSQYTIAAQSDRMGFRLDGPPLEHATPADILSEGIAAGAVQVPADGKPIILLADRQTSGGYTKIATLASSSLPRLVQAFPGGNVALCFRRVTVEEAQAAWRSLLAGLP